MTLRRRVAITGVGETRYVRAPGSGRSSIALQLDAAMRAIDDAGLRPADIDGVIPFSIGPMTAEDFIVNLGLPDLAYSAITPLGGASPVAALQSAGAAIAAGICRHVLISVGRNGWSGDRAAVRTADMPQFRVVNEFERPLGAISPAQLYAPMARLHMETYGTTSRQLGEIAVTMRRHALLNGNAVMTRPITLEDHQASKMITDPFRVLDCSLESDGAACVIVSAADRARDLRQPVVELLGVGEGHPHAPQAISQRDDLLKLGTAKAAARAYAMAGVGPADIDVAEIYDCFTYIVLCQLEDLGFCAKGEGGAFVENGNIALGGKLPVNTHGGLLSQAHVAGLNHVVELARQLRGQGGAAQVAGAKLGLVTGYGDMGDGAVAIFGRA